MKKGLMWGPVVKIILVIAVIIVGYFFLVGSTSRLTPILSKMGLIDASKAVETKEQSALATAREIPPADRQQLEQAIRDIRDSFTACQANFRGSRCTCDLKVSSFPQGYIIRFIAAETGSFIAGYKADRYDGTDIPASEQVAPTTLPSLLPCFSTTLYNGLVSGEKYKAMTPEGAIATLSYTNDQFFNLERWPEGDVAKLHAAIPKMKTGTTDMEYRILGADDSPEQFKLLRVNDNYICFITDREDDDNNRWADVRLGTSQKYLPVVAYLPKCG